MNYIGSKLSILHFISESINSVTGNEFVSFCDLFAGTAVVGHYFKQHGFKVIANDIQYYSYVLARHYIGNNSSLKFEKLISHLGLFKSCSTNPYGCVLSYLNNISGYEGFIYKNYCLGGTEGTQYARQYFSDPNGKKCDHIRLNIEEWKNNQLISDDEYYYLLAVLLESIDRYANTASVYGAFLKKLKKTATRGLELKHIPLTESEFENEVYNQDCMKLIDDIEGDVLYLDPPYNQRQYATNYHLLETIAKYDNPVISGKTGLREYSKQRSLFCQKNKVHQQFETLINKAKFKYIFLSYNNEGLMSSEEIKGIMSKHGEYGVFKRKNTRFKADKETNRTYKNEHTYEYLHYVIKMNSV